MNSNDPYENLDFIPPMYDDICPGYDPKVFKNAKRFIIVMLLILALSDLIEISLKGYEKVFFVCLSYFSMIWLK